MNSLRNSFEWQSFAIGQIKPYPRHARNHNKRQIEKLKKLIRHFGQVVPIVVDRDGVIIDGHAVWRAMQELGSGEIAAVVVANRTGPEIKALRLALNQIPRDTAWDDERLREELGELVNLSFDLDLTGFDAVEIDHLLEVDVPKLNVAEDGEQIAAPQRPAISAVGDIWTCGRHRVGCGDARDQAFVDKVRGDLRASTCFIDPPYNVPIAGFVSGKGRVQHREFVQGTGELSPDQFTTFLVESLSVLKHSATDAALIYACMDWRHIYELLAAGRQCEIDLLNICVWAKTNAGMGSLYRSQHELICLFKAGTSNHTNNVELGRHGRTRSNLWSYRGLNSFGADRDELLVSHPTVKPVLMIADAIRDVTRRGGTVLDTFMGSGSTVMAAEETGRVGIGIDLDPLYVDVAVRRWQACTRRDALHAETGEFFDDRAKRVTSQAQEERHGQQG
jgi:DNA modification methylase